VDVGLRREVAELSVLKAGEGEHGGEGTEEGHEHVGLGVPRVALGTEEIVGVLAEGECAGPLEQFVECADCHGHGDAEHGGESGGVDVAFAQENLAGEEGGDEALEEVADFVVRVAIEGEAVLEPEAEGDACVSVGAAGHEDEAVEGDEAAKKGGEGKGAACGEEEGEGDEGGGDLEEPSEAVVRSPSREGESAGPEASERGDPELRVNGAAHGGQWVVPATWQRDGGAYGARTRNLRRDRAAL